MYFLEKLTGLGVDDGVQINAVFTQLFFMMGLWPAIYAALLIPSARSGNKACLPCMHPTQYCPSACFSRMADLTSMQRFRCIVPSAYNSTNKISTATLSSISVEQIPAWPFVALSFGVGVFGLGPYFALWTPSREAVAPPKPEELEGWNKLALKGTESKIGAWLILAGAVATIAQVYFQPQSCGCLT